jgi:exodeoxyribonuclease-3
VKLVSWNVNGIRAAFRADFPRWFENESADIVCVQETKAQPEFQPTQLDEKILHPLGYHSYWHSAKKPGYSGVAVYTKTEPLNVKIGIGVPDIDNEGRVITLEYSKFKLINAYFPNSQPEHTRLDYKLHFCKKMLAYCESIRASGKNVVLCGDYNIAHREIDLKNPKTNQDTSGFLPEERAWMDEFLSHGYMDTFRYFNQGGDHYTWWSYRAGVRKKNIGWRIDYFSVNQEFKDRLKTTRHQPEIMGSDHCPVILEVR